MIQKIALVALLFVFSVLNSSAQIAKGSILLGGSVGFSSSDSNSNIQSNKNGGFNVSIGKAYKENTIYAFNLSYNLNSTDYPINGTIIGTGNSKNTNFSIGGFLRQYHSLSKDLYFFTDAGGNIPFYNQTTTNTYPNSTDITTAKQIGIQLYLTPGISYNLFKKLQLELSLPNFLSASYLHKSFDGQPYSENLLIFYSSIGGSALSNLGVGFHLVF